MIAATRRLAAVALLGGVFAANDSRWRRRQEGEEGAAKWRSSGGVRRGRQRGGCAEVDRQEGEEGGASPPPSARHLRAAWIDDWKGAGGASADESTPEARATSAQKWIDDWKGAGGASADESTPEGRAASAQKWIDEWKKSQ